MASKTQTQTLTKTVNKIPKPKSLPPQTATVHHVPHADNMFSELQHHPRTVAVQSSRPGAQAMQSSAASAAPLQFANPSVQPAGRDMAMFMGQPRTHQPGIGFNMTMVKYRTDADEAVPEQEAYEPTRTIATQTDYRESETQTDPYTPEYVVRPGSAPEVLTLATLSFGRGLPAGLAEVEMIERARARRAWEATLPPADDPYRAVERAKMLQEQEMKEWQFREQEIEKMQEERMRLLKVMMDEEEERIITRALQRQEQMTMKATMTMNRTRTERQIAGQKHLRKLLKQRQQVEQKRGKRDVVGDYSNPGSSVFAPAAREGIAVQDRNADRYRVASRFNETLGGLEELEASLPSSVTTPVDPRIRLARTQKKMAKKGQRTETRRQQQLMQATTMNVAHLAEGSALPPIQCVEHIDKPAPRPPTPELAAVDASEDEQMAAISFLQALIRGRAAQNDMYRGKEEQKELIAELRSTHALQAAEQEQKQIEKEELLSQRHEEELLEKAERDTRAAVASVPASQAAEMFDFLSKELVRLQEERRIHAFVMLAERERRMREAAEAGRRQKEEAERARNDELFRAMMEVHDQTVDTYLEGIILSAQDQVADDNARTEVREKARKIGALADELHQSGYDETQEGATAIASGLVYSFLLPEVQKETRRQQLQQQQAKYLRSAREALHGGSQESSS